MFTSPSRRRLLLSRHNTRSADTHGGQAWVRGNVNILPPLARLVSNEYGVCALVVVSVFSLEAASVLLYYTRDKKYL